MYLAANGNGLVRVTPIRNLDDGTHSRSDSFAPGFHDPTRSSLVAALRRRWSRRRRHHFAQAVFLWRMR